MTKMIDQIDAYIGEHKHIAYDDIMTFICAARPHDEIAEIKHELDALINDGELVSFTIPGNGSLRLIRLPNAWELWAAECVRRHKLIPFDDWTKYTHHVRVIRAIMKQL